MTFPEVQVPSRFQLSPKVAVSVVFVIGMFMNILDITIVNVALPSIATDFDESAAAVAAVSVGYLVSLAVFIPASGWLGDRFGNKRIFLLALFLFTFASALCGFASSLPQLVGARVIQGAGGGMIMPVGMAMLMHAFPPAERIRAAKILTIPTAFAPALGPVIGGLLVTNYSWEWVFFLNVPIGLFAIVFGLLFVHETREKVIKKFDVPGFVLAGVGLASVMYALSEGASKGWGSPVIIGTAVGGVLLLSLLVLVELRTREPLLDLPLFANGLFRSCNLVIMTASAAFLGAMFLLPVMLQEAMGYSALDSGLATFPTALGVMAASQVSTKYYSSLGPRRVLVAGMVIVTLSLLSLTLVDDGTNVWVIRGIAFVLGLGMANIFIPSQTAAFATIPPARNGGASTLFNVQRQVGSAIGVAVLSSVLVAIGTFTVTPAGPVPDFSAYHWGFVVAAGFALLGIVFALMVKDEDAAATMVPARSKAERRADDAADDPREEAAVSVALEGGDFA
jgi:EmrB/QacA subfamily drug resistance transporter